MTADFKAALYAYLYKSPSINWPRTHTDAIAALVEEHYGDGDVTPAVTHEHYTHREANECAACGPVTPAECTCNPYFGCSEYAADCPRHGWSAPVTPAGGLADAEWIEATLAEHAGWHTPKGERMGDRRRWYCNCGEPVDDDHSGRDILRRHRAHVAARVAAAVEQARADTLREAADAWTQGEWSNVMLPKPTPPAVPVIAYSNRVGDWLRDRARGEGQ